MAPTAWKPLNIRLKPEEWERLQTLAETVSERTGVPVTPTAVAKSCLLKGLQAMREEQGLPEEA